MKNFNQSSEILINAELVTDEDIGDSYEFVINNKLEVIDCIKIISLVNGVYVPIDNAEFELNGLLFELNHVRVNPQLDNTNIIDLISDTLKDIDVNIKNSPAQESMAMCFKPLGEISDNVRFYINPCKQVIFLSPSNKPKLVAK